MAAIRIVGWTVGFQAGIYVAPLALPFVLGATLIAVGLANASIGRSFGGQGGNGSSSILASWQQFVSSAGLLVFTLIGIALPVMETTGVMLFGIYLIWVAINFTAVLHGFDSMGKSIGVTLLSSFIVALVYLSLLNLIGVNV